MDLKTSYSIKDNQYYQHVRHDVISLLPEQKGLSVLEIGAGSGSTLMYLKSNNIVEKAYGVDIMPIADSFQDNEQIDGFFIKNIEEDANLDIPLHSLDVILFPDVLEHLYSPQKAIENLKKYLKPNGYIITSIPNFRNRNAFFRVYVKGTFKYDDRGIFDRTHIRFFCKKDMIDLVEGAGFSINEIVPEYELQYKLLGKRKWTYRKVKLSLGLLEEFYATQYLIVAQLNTR